MSRLGFNFNDVRRDFIYNLIPIHFQHQFYLYSEGFTLENNKPIQTTYSMTKDTLHVVRQLRFIALMVSAFMAIGSICALIIFLQ